MNSPTKVTMLNKKLVKNLADAIQTAAASLSRRQKHTLLIGIDIILFLIAIYGAFALRFSPINPLDKILPYTGLITLLIFIKIISFITMGIYRPVLRYTGLEFFFSATKAVLLSSGTFVLLAYLLEFLQLPRSVLLNDALLTFLLVVGVRYSMRWLVCQLVYRAGQNKPPQRVIIYGAGAGGTQLARALAYQSNYNLIGFVDDDASLQNQIIQGLTVYPPSYLPRLVTQKKLDTILLAMPSVERSVKRQIIEQLQTLSVSVKTVPSIGEILAGKVSISEIRDVDIADLLGREEVAPDPELLKMNITGKSVLVTGAGGSIGSELCRQIAQQQPKCLVLYEMSEFALYNIEMELGETYPNLNKIACLASVLDKNRLSSTLYKYEVDTVYHAAAYKHVPLVEANPAQGIVNNVEGTLTAARCAVDCGVKNFVLISTDKAVRPTNVMGTTKRVAELILQGLAAQPEMTTNFSMVRFGNVLDSSGSVVPRFRKQIAAGEALTLTHPDITRYFMSIPEAARLVIQAGALGKKGEIFLLDMGEPVRIYDLALQMIRLSGLVPGQDIEIKITGLRPGEKLYEELLIDGDNITPTRHPKIFSAREAKIPWEILQARLEVLQTAARHNNRGEIITQLQHLVPEYKPANVAVSLKAPVKVIAPSVECSSGGMAVYTDRLNKSGIHSNANLAH
ncbi:MAG TPA: nucleoside-diphosphate sugar epimerase/dehydratase [Halomicronema sp.]